MKFTIEITQDATPNNVMDALSAVKSAVYNGRKQPWYEEWRKDIIGRERTISDVHGKVIGHWKVEP